jgi:hypothetical protein
VSAHLSHANRPLSDDAIEASIKQCVSDAVEGSFDEYPAHLKPMLRLQARRIFDESRSMPDHSEIRFSFGLPTELFPLKIGGLQLLVNLLAGDMFPTEALGCRWSNVHVNSVELPDGLRSETIQSFRNSAQQNGRY